MGNVRSQSVFAYCLIFDRFILIAEVFCYLIFFFIYTCLNKPIFSYQRCTLRRKHTFCAFSLIRVWFSWGGLTRCHGDGMAEFTQIDALRKQNKYLLDKLEKQTHKLRQLTLSCPDNGHKCHSSGHGESGPHRAPLTERNGANPPRAGASPSTPNTAAKPVNKPGQNILIKTRSLNTFTISHLAEAFIQSDLHMRKIEANEINKDAQTAAQWRVFTTYNCIINYYWINYVIFAIYHSSL